MISKTIIVFLCITNVITGVIAALSQLKYNSVISDAEKWYLAYIKILKELDDNERR